MECLFYSPAMRVAYLISICLFIGFVAPWFINQELQFAPENHNVNGTCHIMMGVRQEVLREESRITYKIHISARNGPFGQPG